MFSIDMDSDIRVLIRDTQGLARQIPFVASRAMNDATFEARHHIVNVTYPQAFEVRNKRFASVLFKVLKKSHKTDLETILGQAVDRGWLANHTTGGTKRPRGGSIAIPVDPSKVRTTTGRVAKPKKPSIITERNKNVFLVKNRSGEKRAIVRARGKNGRELIYVFARQAQIRKTFYFYEDAEKVFSEALRPAFRDHVNRVLRQARFR